MTAQPSESPHVTNPPAALLAAPAKGTLTSRMPDPNAARAQHDGCQPGDLIEVKKVSRVVRKATGSGTVPPPVRRSTIRRPGSS